MTTFGVVGGRPLRGRLRVPGDKSISHRALLLAALADGTSRITGLSDGDDVARTAAAVRALGADVVVEAGDGATTVGGGRDRLVPAGAHLDLGNSGTGMRLLAGVAASLAGTTTLGGDESLSRRPMDRVARPLRLMGATVEGRGDAVLPPLTITGGGLHGIEYELPVPSAQVKAAVLLAGLAAEGETVVRERALTRAHTEEMLAAFGADVEVSDDRLVTCVRASRLTPFRLRVPGDPSQAAFWVVAACVTPGSEVVVEDVYVGQARAGFIDVLARMGADVEVERRDATTADLVARWGPLRATSVGGDEIPGLIDEIPALAVAAAFADGTTTFADAAELRVKESDRVAALVAGLTAVGARAVPRPDGIAVTGGAPLAGGTVDSALDHRIAMAMAVAGLAAADGTVTRIAGWDAVGTSYPGFEAALEDLCR